jgi:archaellum component FlaC
MWERLIAWFQLLWNTGQEVRELRSDVERLQQNEYELYKLVRNLANQNNLLRQELRHERELHERDLKELKLEMRLQIAEELRRLPPTE